MWIFYSFTSHCRKKRFMMIEFCSRISYISLPKIFPYPNLWLPHFVILAFSHPHFPSAFSHPRFIIRILSSAFCHPHFVIRILSSAFCHPHSVICILLSAFYHPHPPSAIRRHPVLSLQRSFKLRVKNFHLVLLKRKS